MMSPANPFMTQGQKYLFLHFALTEQTRSFKSSHKKDKKIPELWHMPEI